MSVPNVTPVVVPVVPSVAAPVTAELTTVVRPNAELISYNRPTKIVGGISVPEYLLDDPDPIEGLDGLAGMVQPPRVRIVQALSNALKEQGHTEGDVVLMPMGLKIGNEATPITIIPLLAYTEFLAINPREATQLFFLRERSMDTRSAIAEKARKRVEEVLPNIKGKKGEDLYITYNEAYNFICWLPDHNVAALFSFMKGEAKYGRSLGSMISMRQNHIYAGMYNLTCSTHNNTGGDKWKGFTPSNAPINQGWTPKEMIPMVRDMHRTFKKELADSNLETVYDDITTEPVENQASAQF